MHSSKKGLLRTTMLAAALFGVYGVAVAEGPEQNWLLCKAPTCSSVPVDGKSYFGVDPNADIRPGNKTFFWVVKGEGATFTLNGGSVTANGHRTRGVGSTAGSNITLNGVTVNTVAGDNNEYAHGVAANGVGSSVTLNDVHINTIGKYSNGIQAEAGSSVTGTNVNISANGGNSYTFGVEAGSDSRIELDGGSITVIGVGAAGARAYTSTPTPEGTNGVFLDGTRINVTGTSSIGLLAGDKDGSKGLTAGKIDYKNGNVSAVKMAAKVSDGSYLELNSAHLVATGAGTKTVVNSKDVFDLTFGLQATGDSTVSVTKGSIAANGAEYTRGVYVESGADITTNDTAISTAGAHSHAVHAAGAGSIITLNGGTVTTGNSNTVATPGYMSWGLYAQSGGQIVSSADVTTQGDGGFGVFAGNWGSGETKITLNDGSITTNGGVNELGDGSHGVISKMTGALVEVNNASITVNGDHSESSRAAALLAEYGGLITTSAATVTTTGDWAFGASTLEGGILDLTNNTQIKTSGANAHGVDLDGAGSKLTMTGGRIETTGSGSKGVGLRNNSSVALTGVTVVSAGPSITSRFTNDTATQSIDIGDGTTLAANDGTLLRVDRDDTATNGVVTLTLAAGSTASGDVSNYNEAGQVVAHDPTKTIIDVQEGALWAGIVIDDKTKIIKDEDGVQTDLTTSGNVSVQGQGSQQFNGTTDIGGSASVGSDQQVSFNGPTTIRADLMGQNGSSTTFSGDIATIIGSVIGATGSSFSFNGPTTIGGNLAGTGAVFNFSQITPTTIAGNVDLVSGSSIGGGSTGTPIQIEGNAQVGSGSTLGGNLNILGILTSVGGTLNPGNSIGTQTYGSLGELSDTTYKVEVNAAGQSDLVKIASGSADLTGVNLVVGQENGNGGYRLNHDYTIVETAEADGISAVAGNKFASEALDESFAKTLVKLDAAKFGANTVKISLSADTSAIDAIRKDLSSNQNATLDGVLSVAGQNASADAALQSADPKDALNQLSGELHGSTQTALLNSSQLVTRTLTNRMRANLGAGLQAGAPTAQASGAVAGSMPTSTAYPLWAQVVGSWNELDGDGNTAKAKSDTTGLFIGADTQVGQGWRVGAAVGFTDGEVKVNDRSSKSDVTSYTAALYGGNSWKTAKGQVNFLAGAAYTNHEVDSRRNVTVGGSQTLKADYDVNTTQLFTELGYAIPVGQASVVEPYLGLAWMSQKAKSFDESGGSAALHGDSQTDDVTTFTLGLRGATTITTGKSEAKLMAGLGWRHASGDVDASRSMSFIEGAGDAFSIAGAPIAKNAAVVDLGAEMNVGKNTALGLSYNGQFGNGVSDNAGSVYVRVRF